MQTAELYSLYREHPAVQTDTRKLRAGDLFFALRGDRYNGNAFAAAALDAGAAYAVIDDPAVAVPGRTILVPDVLKCLQDLARYHRLQFFIPFLAITGSNGKTTTKELIHAVLSTTFRTYTTQGNLNNHIGVPLTLLGIRPDAGIAVIEMGANHQKEIASYCNYALPSHGLITNCGKAHLEGFGGVEGVRKGKGELYDHIRAYGGTVFVMSDYDYLREMSRGIPHCYTYGTQDAQVTGHIVESEPFLTVQITGGSDAGLIRTRLVGSYNLPNVLAAVAVGQYFGVPAAAQKDAIEAYQPSNNRSQLLIRGTHTIILDAYNANPSSMRLAVENFAALPARSKVLVLGAMAELGDATAQEHREILALIRSHSWQHVLLVGAAWPQEEKDILYFGTAAAAADWLRTSNLNDTYFLVKGSRSTQMETVLDALS
ncbi:MAG: hypothetical protein RJA57_1800 [Bacteroidota bacterium]|jgi:UDP-N-acetylmuramoyl-tripeptide--D-alanyl-D-alanine ligase